jgi:hypothetical protein
MMKVRSQNLARTSVLALHVLSPLVTFAFVHWQPDNWSAHNVFRTVLFAEAGMLCVWAGLSEQPWRRRAMGCLVGLALCWLLLRFVDVKQPALKLIECLLFPGAATVALTMAIKSSPEIDDKAGRWQFTVGQLLIFTTMIAVVIALIQQFGEGSLFVNHRLVTSEGSQISVLLMTWAAIRRRWRKARLAIATVMVCAVGLTVQSFRSERWFWDALTNLGGASAFTLWEDLVSIPLTTLVESLLAATTIVLFYERESKR